MSAEADPYEVTRAPVADATPSIARRPLPVTISLWLFWILLTMTALGSYSRLINFEIATDPGSISYIAYLVALVLVPAALLMQVRLARNWARIAMLIFYIMDFMFRTLLFAIGGRHTPPDVAWFIVPPIVQAIAFTLLFLPQSNAWHTRRTGESPATQTKALEDLLQRGGTRPG